MSKFDITQIKGVIPAMITTFDEHEELDLKRAATLTEYLISKGATGLYITGSTGEGFLMTPDERKAFTKTVISTVHGRIPVIVQVGDIGTKKSIDLAVQAKEAGASAVSSVPPFYYRFPADDIFGYYKDLAGATDLPLIVYNVPLAGLLSNSMIYRIAEIPNVRGLKFTGREHDDMCEIKQNLGKDFMVYSGCDEMAAQGLLAGADGIIGSFYNMMCETFIDIYNLCKADKYAEAFEIQKTASSFIHFAVQWDYYPVMRECLRSVGVDAGYSRKPFTAPSAATMDKLWAFCDTLIKQNRDTHMDFVEKRRK